LRAACATPFVPGATCGRLPQEVYGAGPCRNWSASAPTPATGVIRRPGTAVRAESGAEDLARVPPAGGQERAGGRVPHACRSILADRGEPRAVRAESEIPDGVVVDIANGRLLPGCCVKHRDPLARSLDTQSCAVRAYGDGPGPGGGGVDRTRQR